MQIPDEVGSKTTKCRRDLVAALLVRHHHALYGYILACVRNPADADDVLQNMAMAVIEAESPPQSDEDFLRWAREIARRRVLEFQRTSGRIRSIDPQLVERLVDASAWLDENEGIDNLRLALSNCLDQLPDRSRELLLARYGTGREDIERLAKRFKRTVASLYQALYRIRDVLRDCVDRRLEIERR